ncbi:hypothetical protein SADUNF_Sadunf08G0146100 [Salix dunnii]|uniref:Uncharacterized protein n=1 Tax=Salix dunnii TaxID=1413687 RepID=A0A835K1D9_9ROSI|nr:hypothetical protein SADUNF_Sadunf08G0146100 [Salix dunnii]
MSGFRDEEGKRFAGKGIDAKTFLPCQGRPLRLPVSFGKFLLQVRNLRQLVRSFRFTYKDALEKVVKSTCKDALEKVTSESIQNSEESTKQMIQSTIRGEETRSTKHLIQSGISDDETRTKR